jgi:hypothetical protein
MPRIVALTSTAVLLVGLVTAGPATAAGSPSTGVAADLTTLVNPFVGT